MTTNKKTGRQPCLPTWTPTCLMLFMAGALFLGGCSQDDDQGGEGDRTAALFNAGITATRTADGGDTWTPDDKVGIFMVSEGGSLTTAADVLANNAEHTVTNTTTGALSPAGGTIYYPQAGNVDFMAYYPYTGATGSGAGEITTAYAYNISVAGQTSEAAQNALDVLYARNTGVAKTKTAITLSFAHVLSKVTFNVTLGDGLTSLAGSDITAVSFAGMPQEATLDLQDGTLAAGAAGSFPALKAATATAPAVATFTAILVPQPQVLGNPNSSMYTGRTAVFTVGGEIYTWTIPDEEIFAAGNHYTYPVTVKKTGVTVGAPDITDWNTNSHGTSTAEEIGAGIAKVRISAGTFLMGSSDGTNIGNGTGSNTTPAEPNRNNNETQHKVTLTKDFYMSKYQITNAQYAAFLNAKGIDGNGTGGSYGIQTLVGASSGNYDWGLHWNTDKWEPVSGYENHPIINVTWYGAYEYAVWVGGSLPTEAQWEYACRGGQENWPFGIGTGYVLNNTLANFHWGGSWSWNGSDALATITNIGGYPATTQAAGGYAANGYGLYDMHGNVWEWCSDWYDTNYGSANAADVAIDPSGSASGDYRVRRGGSWFSNAQLCRSAYRIYNYPDDANYLVGFRVVFVP